MRKKVYKFHTLQTELKNIDPYAFCFGNTYMGVPPCTCPGSMQDHKLRTNLGHILCFESWISWFIPNKNAWNIPILYDSQIQNLLNFKNHFKSHAYLKFWLESTVSFLSRSACIESSQWFVNASYCPLCWTCMELEWSLGLRADVGEPAGQFWHTRHAA